MITVMGVYPNQRRAVAVKQTLESDRLGDGSVTLHTREDMGEVEQILSTVTPFKSHTSTGLVAGAFAGGVLGMLLGMALFPAEGSNIPAFIYCLAGLFPFAVLGGYLGSLFGSRSAENPKMNIKERVWNEDAVLVVARVDSKDENFVVQSMLATDGEFVFAREANEGDSEEAPTLAES